YADGDAGIPRDARRRGDSFNGAAGLRRRRRLHRVDVQQGLRASMGPPAYADGDTPDGVTVGGGLALLQWGRRPTPTETYRRRLPALVERRASMGPPAYADGDLYSSHAENIVTHASMGPPAYADGDVEQVVPGAVAVAALQWGRRPTPTETPQTSRGSPSTTRFNGAAGLRRRRPTGKRGRPALPSPGFNGAAGLRRRRRRAEVAAQAVT